MNKISKNYLSKLNLRETQEAQSFLKNILLKEINEKFEVLVVREPKVSSKKITATSLLKDGDRTINFDSSNDNVIYTLYSEYKYWLVSVIEKLEIKNNHGILSFINFINRDKEITNVSSFEQNLLQIEYRYDNKEKIFEKSKELLKIFINIFKIMEDKIIRKFPKLIKNFPKHIYIKNLNEIGNQMSFESLIAEIGAEKGIFSLVNKKTIDNKSFINSFEIFLMSYSKEINKAYTILNIQDRKTIQDLKPNISESESIMEEFIFKKDFIKQKEIRTINISINLDLLFLILLNKAHILEIQSGKNIDEIEKILSGADIIHL